MKEKMEMRETGTTTVGIVCKDAVILASEGKSTLGYLVSSKSAQKVYQIDDKIALTTAGGAGDTQALCRILKAEINIYKTMRNTDFTVNATISLLSNILQQNRYYPYMAMLIVGGHDRDGFHVWTLDAMGGAEKDKSVATGSGSPFAYGVLEADYKENMTKEEGIRLVVKAIRSARERDIFSGGKIQVCVITKDNLEFVDDTKIDEILKTFNK
ncbi:MAG: archaeal proteasome endopeptidase complex subunit beta [Candidatus Aenigmarchaeota archaeon]|nr:archaeal proteasome endopeptidase complex subunit beta [Candidatus Aenigmarchaeota archaeon]